MNHTFYNHLPQEEGVICIPDNYLSIDLHSIKNMLMDEHNKTVCIWMSNTHELFNDFLKLGGCLIHGVPNIAVLTLNNLLIPKDKKEKDTNHVADSRP